MNKTSSRHIITIEDPIEYVHAPLQSVVTQRQVGRHVESFASALRSSLRESPDVVVTGEMRDLGNHSSRPASGRDRRARVRDAAHQLRLQGGRPDHRRVPDESREQVRGVVSVMLRGVLAQMLCKRASGEGRVAVLEVMLQPSAIANLIRESKCYQIDVYLQTADPGSGMQSLDAASSIHQAGHHHPGRRLARGQYPNHQAWRLSSPKRSNGAVAQRGWSRRRHWRSAPSGTCGQAYTRAGAHDDR